MNYTSTKFLPFLALASLLAFGTACEEELDPNEEINDQLQGEWEVESWTRDGTEQMGFTVNSWDLDFDKEEPFEGELEWDINYRDGSGEKIDWNYEVTRNGTELELSNDNVRREADIDLDGDDLEMVLTINSERWIIEAERD